MNPSPSPLELAFATGSQLTLTEVSAGMLVALALGLFVALIYRSSVPDRIVSPAMMGTLVMLSMVGAMVMMVIGNSLARAFSLVGALAIIRFRARLKSPWDITFVFFSLAAGIAAGTFAWPVAVGGTLIIGLSVLALTVLPFGALKLKLHMLRVDLAAHQEVEHRVEPVLKQYLRQWWLVEARSVRFGETLSYRWRVTLKEEDSFSAFIQALAAVEGVERCMLSPDDDGSGETD